MLLNFYSRIICGSILASLIFSFSAHSQTEGWLWADHAGGLYNQAAGYSIASDLSGHMLVAGSFSSFSLTFGTITLPNNGGDDIFLAKYDTSGNVLWAKSAGSSYAEECYGVATDASGNVYVTGEFWSANVAFGSYGLTNSGGADVFLVKYDSNGNVLWARSAVATGDDHSNAVATDASGNIYITGSFLSNSISFDNVTLTNSANGYEDLFIAKYDSNGNIVWAFNPVGSNRDQGFGIATDPAGNVLVAGNFRSFQLDFGNVALTNWGSDDMFIVKLDSNGNALWANNANGSGNDYSFTLTTDEDGNAYTAGYFFSYFFTFGTTTLNSQGGSDIFVAKYDSSGNLEWAQSAGGSSYDYCEGLAIDKNHNVFVAGSFQSPDMTFGTSTIMNHASSGYDFFIAKFDSSGNSLWANNDGSTETAWGYNCAADEAGSLYVTGLFGSTTMTLDAITLTTTTGYYDMFLAKYGLSECSNIFYQDADNDGYGNVNVTAVACTAPVGYVSDSTDCDDTNAAINPAAIEISNNGIDENCDGYDGKATGIGSLNTDNDQLNIYPNPTNNIFNVDLSFTKNIKGDAIIELRNSLGKNIYTENVSINKNERIKEISFGSSIADGMYLVNVIIDGKVYSQQVILQR